MTSFFGQIFTLLTAPPGNLIYHFVLVFSIAGALQAAVHYWRTSGFPQARRTVIGLSILIVFQLILFLFSGLTRLGLLNSLVVLPPMDRVVSFLSMVWIIWLWAFPEPVSNADIASVLITFLGLALFGITTIFNSPASPSGFNSTMSEIIWQVFSLGVVFLGFLAMVIRRPNGWGNGVAMLILAFLGHFATMIWRMNGDYPGLLRIAHLAMFPILLTLVQRYPAVGRQERRKSTIVDKEAGETKETKGVKDSKEAKEPVWEERRRYSTDPKTFQSLINLASVTSSEKIYQNLTRSIAQAMLADLCFMIMLGEDKNLAIVCGYDLIREESLSGTVVDKDAIPLLYNAVQRLRPLRMPASSTSSDMKGLGKLLGLSTVGHLLYVPIASPEGGPTGGIIILSPYSDRLWNAEDQVYLSNVSALLLPVIERGEKIAALEVERDNAKLEVKSIQEDLVQLTQKLEEAPKEAAPSPEVSAQLKLQAENLASMMVMQEEAQRTIDQLRKDQGLSIAEVERLRGENEQLKASAQPAPEASDKVEQDLRMTLKEMARMQNTLAESNQKVMELESRPTVPITNEQVEVIASISQDLRQPMSSIIGYTDLLLGESVGILGALQRKFVERVKASTERIGGLIDDLIQITNLDAGHKIFKPEMIDLNLIIDNAMAYTGTQIREKNITMRLDIPEASPEFMTDRDALQQVLIHLLQNATAVTQMEGIITLRVQMKAEEEKNFLAILVTDTGGGIASEDLPRVFARRYRAEHSLIQGVGDTGVGLSIAKTLVEGQGGRIWVETEANVGSTFSVLLPVLEIETEA